MTVISIKDRSTKDRALYEKFKSSDNSLIYSDAGVIDEFSVELTIGNSWAEIIDKNNPDMYAFNGGKAVLKPNTSVVIEVDEEISVPYNMYGIIVPTGSAFLQMGIIIGAGKIEPSYSGKLKVLLYNTSRSKIDIFSGTKFASAIFFRTDRTINHQLPVLSGAVNIKKKSKFEKFLEFILSDKKNLMNNLFLISTSSVAAYFLGEIFK